MAAIGTAQATALAADAHLHGKPRTRYALWLLAYTADQATRADRHLTNILFLLGEQHYLGYGDDHVRQKLRLPAIPAEITAEYEAAAKLLRDARNALIISVDIARDDFNWRRPVWRRRPWGDAGSPPPEPPSLLDLQDMRRYLSETA
ncbi:hypothetical protein ABZW30_08120 [Kitasatospora sp. NPDC004669]|uniref:hypothetical protein n=1 Tax=Kitasatospora sp. NPDC004669 TaxID=3154555 RepID=UPI0033AEC516